MVTTNCFVIAEAGVNHNGSIDMAMKLVEGAAAAGADAIKFQTFTAESLVGKGVEKAAYQQVATAAGDQQAMLKSLELGFREHQLLFDLCKSLGIEFMSTPFDERALEFLVDLGVKRIKVASGELTNKPFLERIAQCDLPIILSTGMSTLSEVGEALEWISEARKRGSRGFSGLADVSLLHCTSNYPTDCRDVNLRAMTTLAKEFSLPAGYSDHTAGIAIATAAVALGATIIEKHFTLDRSLPGPDHAASLELPELQSMVSAIREVELSLGDGIKMPRPSELPVRSLVRRSVAVCMDLPAGHIIKLNDLTLMRPETGIAPKDIDTVVGRTLKRNMTAGDVVQQLDLV